LASSSFNYKVNTSYLILSWVYLFLSLSAKFSRKVVYINRLGQLEEYVHLESIQIPVEVKK